MAKIRPKIGDKVKFNLWFDTEYLGKVYTDPGNGIDRPSNFDQWTGIIVHIDEPTKYSNGNRKNIHSLNEYHIRRDFDEYEQILTIKNIVGYVN